MADQSGRCGQQENQEHPPAEGHEMPPVPRLLQAPPPPVAPSCKRSGIAVIIGLLFVLLIVLLIVLLRG